MRTTRVHRWTAAALTAMVAGSLIPATAAHAGSEGRRNTAIAATAATAYLGYKYAQKPSTKRAIPAVIAAGGTYYAWSKYNEKKQQEKAQERAAYIDYGRRTAYRGHGHAYGHEVAGYRGNRGHHYGQRKHHHHR